MTTRFLLLKKGAAYLLCALLLSSCAGHQQESYESAPVDVDFMAVQPTDAAVEQRYPGTIEGLVNVDVKAQVSGYLATIYVKEGDYVQQGQTLFKIKDDVYNEQVENSQAQLLAAQAAEESARIELQKIKPLVTGKVVTELQLQTAEANYAAAKAQVAQAKATLGSSRINAGFTLIKAPVSGYIGRIPNRVGNLITPTDATPLTTLSEINQVLVYFSLSEADYIAFMQDQQEDAGMNTVELIMATGTVYAQTGRIESASGNVDRMTGSVPLKAVFANPDRVLRSGGSGKIVIRKNLKQVLTIPMASVKDIQNKYFVFALADSNKVAMKPIEIAGHTADQYIVKSGLQAGEKIALNRIDVLAEGMPVKPTAGKQAAAQQ
ncbi:efflux RND transporter periplasmic adaptor subunit [Sphingobacterium bambusae]|uniref:Efflux RND transporter periplasmic adaptor subunit n=1 Tax=Sphingobacterium bambusae TaxID=662858 RepID=A0ABW6BJ19_9SPHI|nr:efflux RND transporter periplasmic adaptor subunit [Sphingobacterium bambusae]WPL49769.1 efflux RND transporter periplasmic adaptor subunit [Sphingobacterium bambusae]